MKFNTDKCKTLTLNTNSKNYQFSLGDVTLEMVKMYKYLGGVISTTRLTSLFTRHIALAIKKAEKRINCIKHFGFESDGLRTATCVWMYKVLVRPILEYAAQVLSYKHYYFTSRRKPTTIHKPSDLLLKLEECQNRVLKLLVPCPKNTPPELVRLLTGTMPLSAHIDILKLRYFWKLSKRNKNNITFKIYNYKRQNFLESNVGYIHEIFNICCKYNMMWVWHGVLKPKQNPFSAIKKQVVAYHLKRDLSKARTVNCLYSVLCIRHKKYGKKYRLESFLKNFGTFESSEHRRFFLYSFLDTCAYSRKCPKCYCTVNDILQHTLKDY